MWPRYIPDQFHRVPESAAEEAFYGPWNSVLTHCFPPSEGFMISPQKLVGEKDSIDFVIYLLVERNEAAIFFVEIKPRKDLISTYRRNEAAQQMRTRFFQLMDYSPSLLHGVSAFGSQIAFFLKDQNTGEVTPVPAAVSTTTIMKDEAPAAWWSTDLLAQEGYDKFMELVERTKLCGTIER